MTGPTGPAAYRLTYGVCHHIHAVWFSSVVPALLIIRDNSQTDVENTRSGDECSHVAK
jgi:hypothetical protein